jgi:hypothetical protein
MAVSGRWAGLLESTWAYRLRELRHRWTFPRTYHRMDQVRRRHRECADRKPAALVRREMRASRRFWGCEPLHYLRYGLYRADRPLTERQLLAYIPEFFFYSLFLPYHDSEDDAVVLRDKLLAEQLFHGTGIRQPPSVGKLVHGRLVARDLRETTFAALLGALRERDAAKVFVKPADGQGGRGIWIFARTADGGYATAEGEALSEALLLRLAAERDYVVQPGIVQAAHMSAVHPHSVNSFRTVTENLHGRVRVVCSVLRAGRSGRQVDNTCQDGLVVPHDVETGTVVAPAFTELEESFARHPDTGFALVGWRIPGWDEVARFAVESAARLPQFTYLGWDIAVDEEGPLAIETNLGFGLDGFQVGVGGLREAYRIEDPSFYWRHRRPRR